MTKEIVKFMKDSPKRLNLLDKLTELNTYPKLKPLCPTRWTLRASSMNVLLINYCLMKTALIEIGQEGGYSAPKAIGLSEQMNKFSNYFGLKLGKYTDLHSFLCGAQQTLSMIFSFSENSNRSMLVTSKSNEVEKTDCSFYTCHVNKGSSEGQ
jgi:hypothetical protein